MKVTEIPSGKKFTIEISQIEIEAMEDEFENTSDQFTSPVIYNLLTNLGVFS